MPDFLDQKRDEIDNRIAELKPVLAEYAALEQAAKALGSLGAPRVASSAAPRGTRGRRKPGRPRGSKTRTTAAKITTAAKTTAAKPPAKRGRPGRPKGTGQRAVEALTLVQAQPGITIPELAAKMGIKQNYLYRVLPGLQKEKKIAKRGRGWHPKGNAAVAA